MDESMTFFSPWGINNVILNWTNESKRIKDATRIKENLEGNNMARKTILLNCGKCIVVTKKTSSNISSSMSLKNIKKKKKSINKLTKDWR
jgi:hypothetical protein